MLMNINYGLLTALSGLNTTSTTGSIPAAVTGDDSFRNLMLSYLLNNGSVNSGYGSLYSANNNSYTPVYNNAGTAQINNPALSTTQSMDDIFAEASRTYGVPVNLLKAVAKAESNFDPNVVSSAGAQGVMQLMPGTAKELGVTDPFDARSNIMGGAKYLADKLNQYNGDYELTLAAYNAGSGNVRKYGGVPPFKETQNYIKKVLGYMNQDLTTGKTVQGNALSSAPNVSGNALGKTQNNGSVQMASYFVEMLKLQMQMQMQNALGSSASDLGGTGLGLEL